MSVLFSQNTDIVKTNMQEHNRDAMSIQTVAVGEVVETSKVEDYPPPLLKENRRKQAWNHLPPLPSPTKCHKRVQERDHPPPHQKTQMLVQVLKLRQSFKDMKNFSPF
ncbi:hypothetical protein P9112_004523 [Eukaryota sp. TZLM1-RC]